jgi:small subunit ribosomal protein S17e
LRLSKSIEDFETFLNHPFVDIFMGRIKTKLIKRLTFEIMKQRERLSPEFEGNKKVVAGLLGGASKKIRNSVAGYVTRLMKIKEEY